MLVAFLAIASLSVVISSVGVGISLALLPQSYVEDVKDAELDWWTAKDYLDLDAVKETVSEWFSDSMYSFDVFLKEPIVIAVIDSGLSYDHVMFTGDVEEGEDVGEYDVLMRSGKAIVGFNTMDNSTNIQDDATNRHGTHVAGIIATLIHETGLEKYIKILPIKAGKPNGTGASFQASDVREGIDYALRCGADVINMSLESSQKSFDFVTTADASKAVIVAAAGNGSNTTKTGYDSAKNPTYPAANSNVIGVMNYASDPTAENGMVLATSSNYGSRYDLAAPGYGIYSADGATTDGYKSLNGTSMAAPVVSFAAALATLKYEAIEKATATPIGPVEIANIVRNSYTKIIQKGNYQLKALNLHMLALGEDSLYAQIDVAADGGQVTQQLGSLKAVKMSLDVLPTSRDGKGSVQWFADDEHIGDGFEISYLPKSQAGVTLIKAIWAPEGYLPTIEATLQLKVNYRRIDKNNIADVGVRILNKDGTLSTSARLQSGEKYTLVPTGIDYIDPAVAEGMIWFLNGKPVYQGSRYEFEPPERGSYQFSVAIGSLTSPVSVLGFDYFLQNVVIAAVSVSVTLALAVAAAIVIGVVCVRRKAKREERP